MFSLFAFARTDENLGMIDPEAVTVEVSIAGKDYTLQQSPGVLHSKRSQGTTGAAIWRTGLLMATWLVSDQSPISRVADRVLASTAVELGCGISALLALSLRGKVGRYIATDQSYILQRFDENVRMNKDQNSGKQKQLKRGSGRLQSKGNATIETLPLDWEIHDISRQLRQHLGSTADSASSQSYIDISLVLSCDCVFNESLVEPFVDACRSICTLQRSQGSGKEALCIIGQQLRMPDVLELWMSSMLRHFRLFRVKQSYLTDGLKEPSAFVVHLAMLK